MSQLNPNLSQLIPNLTQLNPKLSQFAPNPQFGISSAKKAILETGVVLVVEGYFDVISLHNAGES